MKKNAMLKIAAVLLVAVLLTTCAISSTFAKYASSGEVYNSSARVAKWGLDVNLTAMSDKNIFSDNYADGVAGTVGTKELVVAPGTSGSLNIAGIVTGQAEVSAQIRYTVKVETSGFSNTYMPITVTAGGDDITIDGNEHDAGAPTPINANTTVNTEDHLTVSWNWDFDGDDVEDTKLGKAGNATIRIIVKAYIEQTDDSVVSNTPVAP